VAKMWSEFRPRKTPSVRGVERRVRVLFTPFRTGAAHIVQLGMIAVGETGEPGAPEKACRADEMSGTGAHDGRHTEGERGDGHDANHNPDRASLVPAPDAESGRRGANCATSTTVPLIKAKQKESE
jgi:hypothetical protein